MPSARILVVDANSTVRRVIARTLADAGYEVLLAEQAHSGLELARTKAPALVLADTALPDLSAEAFRGALESVANTKHLPVVWMSVRAEHLSDEAIEPFSPEALLAVTAHAIVRSSGTVSPTSPGTTSSPGKLSSPGSIQVRAGRAEDISFLGRIDHVPLGDVLQMLQHQRQTGVVELSRPDRILAICIDRGEIDLALAEGANDDSQLGRYLLEEQLIDAELLEGMLDHPSHSFLGTRLVKTGNLAPEDLQRVLVRQTSERLYEALRWKHGEYRFVRGASRPQAKAAKLGLSLSAILMEGLRRVDEWRLIEEQIRSWDEVYRVDREALLAVDLDRFSRDERAVLGAVDGFRSVRAIVSHTHLGSFEASKILFQLLTSRLIRRVR
jgi:CheY-like chemotaxis protein